MATTGLHSSTAVETPAGAVAEICQEVERACRDLLSSSLRAVILTGSLARDEGSFLRNQHGWLLLGDADFLAVVDGGSVPGSVIDEIRRQSISALRRHGITAEIGIGIVAPEFFRKLRPHIFAYELRSCGRVIDGDATILSQIPAFTSEDIPRHDAFRLLANRMIELLEPIAQLEPRSTHAPGLRYAIDKLYLDMATSLLVFYGQYAPTYSERLERLRRLAESASVSDAPFQLREFAERVAVCTESKLHPLETEFSLDDLHQAIDCARALWQWELRRLRQERQGFARVFGGSEMPACESFEQWLRGWLYVLRHEGWHRGWRQWSRWLRLCLKASPRYLVYSAACELFFVVPKIEQGGSLSLFAPLRDRIPLVEQASPGQADDWRALAREITHNYKELLVGTRS